MSTMFPHTITLYNITRKTDKLTMEDTFENHITFLRGVLVDSAKSADVTEDGTESADSVTVYIPFDVEAVNAENGKRQRYATPRQWADAGRKSVLWTFNTDKTTFFVKGENVRSFSSLAEIDEAEDTFMVTQVETKDFGDLQHWEVGGA